MRAEIVSVGTELLLGQIVDSNAAWLGAELADCGIHHLRRQTVGDNLPRLIEALELAVSRAEVVITIGGLGPTEDDLTRDGIAAVLGETLEIDSEIERHLERLFRERGFPFQESQRRQAMRPASARPLANPNGTAPGLLAEKDGRVLIALPGPPNELKRMFTHEVRPWLTERSGNAISSRILRVIGIGEAALEKEIIDLIHSPDPTVAPYAKLGEVHLRLTTTGPKETLDQMEAAIRDRLGSAVYATGSTSLEDHLIDLLRGREWRVATAESCTGGAVAQRLTSVSGASDVFAAGWVTYQWEGKTRELGVPRDLLEVHGAISPECAAAMAEGALTRSNANIAVSVTGVAGPGAVMENGVEKPAGMVLIGVATATGTTTERLKLIGDRGTVQARAAQSALAALRTKLLAGT